MQERRSKLISPIVDYCWPDLSDEEKQKKTEVIRPYFEAMYEICYRLEKEGWFERDSRSSKDNGRVRVE